MDSGNFNEYEDGTKAFKFKRNAFENMYQKNLSSHEIEFDLSSGSNEPFGDIKIIPNYTENGEPVSEDQENKFILNEKCQSIFPEFDLDLDTSNFSNSDEIPRHPLSMSYKDREKFLGNYELIKILGSGAHGFVVRVRNEFGEDKAAKLYEMKYVDLFLNEVSVLSMLTGIKFVDPNEWEIFQTQHFYGIILKEGIGSLAQFKQFLLETNTNLNEQELLGILSDLLKNYRDLMSINFCHRDIKPSNILVYSDQLSPKFIDYGLAICTKPSKIHQSIAGTKGYISSDLFKKETCENSEELILGDLFSIGVTLLELANPRFKPKQDKKDKLEDKLEDQLENQLSKLGQEKKKLKGILELLMFPKKRKPKFLVDLLKPDDIQEKNPLKKYYEQFKQYFSKKLDMRIDYYIDRESESYSRISAAFGYFTAGMTQGNFVENMNNAANKYLEASMMTNALICYENIVKYYIKENKPKQALLNCELILKKLKDDNSIKVDSLLYSTLGTCFYLQDDIARAKEMFKIGLEMSRENLSKLIFLNNNACLSFGEEDQFDQSFMKAGDLFEEMKMTDCFNYIIEAWLNKKFRSSNKSLKLQQVQTKRRERLFEIIFSRAGPILRNIDLEKQETKLLFWTMFLNFCSYQAHYLIRTLSNDHQIILQKSINKFLSFFKIQTNSKREFEPISQAFIIFERFRKIFLDPNISTIQTSQIIKLVKESESFHTNPKQIFAEFGPTILTKGLFTTMIGFTVNCYDQNFEERILEYGQDYDNGILSLGPFEKVINVSYQSETLVDCPELPQLPELPWGGSIKHLHLKFENCEKITSIKWLEPVFKCKTLLELELSLTWAINFNDIQMMSLVEGLRFLRDLRSLKIFMNWSYLTDKGILMLLEACKSLTELREFSLKLESCPDFTDKSIFKLAVAISVVCSYLEDLELHFSSCKGISSNGMEQIKSFLKSLPSLKDPKVYWDSCDLEEWVREYEKYYDEDISSSQSFKIAANVSSQPKLIADCRLPKKPDDIEYLCLRFDNCQQLTRCPKSVLNCKKLLKLELSFTWAVNFEDNQMMSLAKGLKFLSELRSFKFFLSWGYFTDKGIMMLREACKSLTELRKISLKLQYCPNFTEKSILKFTKVIPVICSNLEDLRLSFSSCKGIYPNGIQKIEESLQSVPSLKVSIQYLIANNKKLLIIEEPRHFGPSNFISY